MRINMSASANASASAASLSSGFTLMSFPDHNGPRIRFAGLLSMGLEQSVVAKPLDGVCNAFGRRAPSISELARGFRARKEHALARQAHTFERHAAAAPRERGPALRDIGDRQHSCIRQSNPRRAAAREQCNVRQDSLQTQVLAAEDVALAGTPSMKDRKST